MPRPNEIRTGFVEINGADLYYEVAGAGYPLLLLHAGVADSRMWDDQFELFARDYQVVRYDLRGYGRSVVPARAFAHHEEAARLLRSLGIDRAHVLGASYGGYVAVDFTLAYPEMVESLVLCAPNVSGYEPSSAEMHQFFAAEDEALERGDLEAATELNLRMWVDGRHRTPAQVDPTVRERVRAMQRHAFGVPVPETAALKSLSPPAVARLKEIDVPALVIVGEHDVPEFVRISELVAAGIGGAKRVVIPNVAHLPSMEAPAVFNQLVLDFWRGL